MIFSVGDALNLEVMRSTKLLAGSTGLAREIIWVNVNEVIDEFDFFREGELLITTGIGLESDNASFIDELLHQFVKRKMSCLALQTGYYLPQVPPLLIRKCDEYHFPLIELPKSVSFTEIIKAVLEKVLHCQLDKIEYAQRINQQLTEVSLKGKGLAQIAEVLSKLVDSRILILDRSLTLLADYPPVAESDWPQCLDTLKDKIPSITAGRLTTAELQLLKGDVPERCPYHLEPIRIDQNIYGFIAVDCRYHLLSDFDLIAVTQATMIVALEMLKVEAITEAEERLKGDFLDELIEGNYSESSLYRYSSYLGFETDAQFIVLVADIDNFFQTSKKTDEYKLLEIREQFLSLVRSTLAAQRKKALFKFRIDRMIILLPVDSHLPKDHAKLFGDLIRQKAELALPVTITIGVGRCCKGFPEVRKSFQEAEKALSIMKRLGKRNQTVSFDELNVYCLFASLENFQELEKYYLETIYPLTRYDQENNTNLFETLEAYFQSTGSIAEIADSLFIHRHTLKYRLNRIREITGLDPQNHQDFFKLQLGVIITQLLESAGEPLDDKSCSLL